MYHGSHYQSHLPLSRSTKRQMMDSKDSMSLAMTSLGCRQRRGLMLCMRQMKVGRTIVSRSSRRIRRPKQRRSGEKYKSRGTTRMSIKKQASAHRLSKTGGRMKRPQRPSLEPKHRAFLRRSRTSCPIPKIGNGRHLQPWMCTMPTMISEHCCKQPVSRACYTRMMLVMMAKRPLMLRLQGGHRTHCIRN